MPNKSHLVVGVIAAGLGFCAGRNTVTQSPQEVVQVIPNAATIPIADETDTVAFLNSVRTGESSRSILLDRFNEIADKDGVATMMRSADEMASQLQVGEVHLRMLLRWAQCSVAHDRSDGNLDLSKRWDETVFLLRELRARRLWDEVALLYDRGNAFQVSNDEQIEKRKQFEYFVDAMQSHREYCNSRGVGTTRDYPKRQYLNRLYSESAAPAVALATDNDLKGLTINLIAMESIAARCRGKFSNVSFANTSTDVMCWDAVRLCDSILADNTRRFVQITADPDDVKHVAIFSELMRGYLQKKTALWMESSLLRHMPDNVNNE